MICAYNAERTMDACLASLRKLDGLRTIVCTVTGHGLKDPERAVSVSKAVEKVEADPHVLRRVILE